MLLHGGVRAVLGLEGHLGAIASEMSVWAGVVVMPSERAYARPPDEEPEDAEMPQATPVAAAPSASVPAQSAAAAAQVVASAAAAAQVVASAAAATRPAQPTPPAAVGNHALSASYTEVETYSTRIVLYSYYTSRSVMQSR